MWCEQRASWAQAMGVGHGHLLTVSDVGHPRRHCKGGKPRAGGLAATLAHCCMKEGAPSRSEKQLVEEFPSISLKEQFRAIEVI